MSKNSPEHARSQRPPERVRLTRENVSMFPSFKTLVDQGLAKFDANGRLRYLHGAPVGDLILSRVNKDGTPIYKESAKEWFDADSERANQFRWPAES